MQSSVTTRSAGATHDLIASKLVSDLTAIIRTVSIPTRVTMDAEAILRKTLEEIALKNDHDTNNIQTKEISSGGANYMTTLFLATISSPGRSDLKLFAKLALVSEAMRAFIPATKLFLIETIVYTELMPQLEQLQDEYKISIKDRIRFPKCYGTSNVYLEETVVLEDLTSSGFTDQDRFKTITWEYAKTATTQLAKWHALSMAFEHQYPEQAQEYFTKMVFSMSSDEAREAAGKKMAEGAVQIVKEEFREKLVNFLGNLKADDQFKIYQPRRKTVLAHGDFRPSNMMHRTKDGKLEIVVIDYQTVHAGCPATDLVYFIVTATDQDLRQKHYKQLIDHYYTELTESLKRFNLNADEIYSKSVFLEDLDESMKAHALAFAIFFLPIVTVDYENAPKLSDAESIDCFAVKPNETYAKRFNGIMEDLVSWGIV